MMHDLTSGLPHYGPYSPLIGLAVLAAVVIVVAVAVFHSSRHH
jgi:hypothetical protein